MPGSKVSVSDVYSCSIELQAKLQRPVVWVGTPPPLYQQRLLRVLGKRQQVSGNLLAPVFYRLLFQPCQHDYNSNKVMESWKSPRWKASFTMFCLQSNYPSWLRDQQRDPSVSAVSEPQSSRNTTAHQLFLLSPAPGSETLCICFIHSLYHRTHEGGSRENLFFKYTV